MELSESGLVIVITRIDRLKFSSDKGNPAGGGSFIELPEWLKRKRACINVQNEGEKRFQYSIRCGVCVCNVYEKNNPNRMYHYKNLDDGLNCASVAFPSTNIDIDRQV